MPRPWFPILGTAGFVVGSFASSWAPLAWLIRPLLVALVVGAIGSVLVAIALRQVTWGWWPRAIRIANIVTGAWLAIAIVMTVPALVPPAVDLTLPVTPTAGANRPNVYLIMLDAYARADTLAGFGFDNEPFLAALEQRGFDVAHQSRGHYLLTTQVMAVTLSMRHLDELPSVPDSVADQRRLLRAIIDKAPVFAAFHDMGYQVVVSPSSSAEVSLLGSDEVLGPHRINELEMTMLRQLGLDGLIAKVVPDLLPSQFRDAIRANLADVVDVAHQPGPHVMLAHVMSPHPPFVFAADGSAATPPACFPERCPLGATSLTDLGLDLEEYGQRYSAQVAALNNLVLPTLDAVIEADPGAIVIVASDHGSRYDALDHAEWYRSFFAARTPGQPALFPDDASLIDTFPTLFSAYFNAPRYEMADVTFESDGRGPVKVWRVTP